MFWTSWSKAKEIRKLLRSSFASYKRLEVCAQRNHYRQIEELQRGKSRTACECRTPTTEVWEQPCGEFTSANEIARACNETVQVRGPCATVSLRLRHHWLTLPRATTHVPSKWLSGSDEVEIQCLGTSYSDRAINQLIPIMKFG
jgi:hypothetical protein